MKLLEKENGHNDPQIGQIYDALGIVSLCKEDKEGASSYFEMALNNKINQPIQDELEIAISYTNLAHYHEQSRSFEKAYVYIKKARDIR